MVLALPAPPSEEEEEEERVMHEVEEMLLEEGMDHSRHSESRPFIRYLHALARCSCTLFTGDTTCATIVYFIPMSPESDDGDGSSGDEEEEDRLDVDSEGAWEDPFMFSLEIRDANARLAELQAQEWVTHIHNLPACFKEISHGMTFFIFAERPRVTVLAHV